MVFPDWVERFRTKGTAINCINGRYYLYQVHSERIKGTAKVRKITDRYLGRITKDGLIPPKNKIVGEILIKEYGIYAFLLSLNAITIKRIILDFPNDYPSIITIALVRLVHNNYNQLLYDNSYLSIVYPNVNISTLNDTALLTIDRLMRMIHSSLEKHKLDIDELINALFSTVMVYVNQEWMVSEVNTTALALINKYNINMRGILCQE